MKKLLALLLAAIMVLSLAACASTATTDAPAQTTEAAALRFVEGDGADAGAAVPHPHPCLIAAILFGERRCQGAGVNVLLSGERNGDGAALGGGDRRLKLLIGGDGLAVDGLDEVTGLDARLLCRTAGTLCGFHIAHPHHQCSVHAQLDAKGLTAGDEQRRFDLLDFHLFDGNQPEQPEGDAL